MWLLNDAPPLPMAAKHRIPLTLPTPPRLPWLAKGASGRRHGFLGMGCVASWPHTQPHRHTLYANAFPSWSREPAPQSRQPPRPQVPNTPPSTHADFTYVIHPTSVVSLTPQLQRLASDASTLPTASTTSRLLLPRLQLR